MIKKINLNNSFIYTYDGTNNVRHAIKSVLRNISKKCNFYLVKECRAESISKNPFLETPRREFLPIFNESGNDIIFRNRTIEVSLFKQNVDFTSQKKGAKKKIILKKKIMKILSPMQVFKKLYQKTNSKFLVEINFKYQNNKYSLLSKCDYLNFSNKLVKKKDKIYIQPISGYIPFEKNNKLFIGYFAKHIPVDNKKSLDLEILLRKKESLFFTDNQNIFRKTLKKTLNILLFFLKKNEFSDYIVIKNSKATFFECN